MRLLAQFVGVLLWSVSSARISGGSSPRWPLSRWCTSTRRWWLAHRQREAEHGAIAARADQQHAWVLSGR